MLKRLTLFLSLFLLGLSSCKTNKDLFIYNFRNGTEQAPTLAQLPKQEIGNQADLRLQTNDILGIIILSPDGILATPYNLTSPQMGGQGINATSPSTFIINKDGLIDLPSLGSFKASGLTLKELQASIIKKLSILLENPSVNIRLLNFKVTVSGEVTKPGIVVVEGERLTLLEAISQAGDLTPYSNREHIMVIRENNGVREYAEVNLKDTKLFTSPYYYLQQNDVIYVEPTKLKIRQVQQIDNNTYLQPIQTALSVILSTITLIFLFKK
jgi:polysaccharide biosynthesis/export protein